MAELTVADAGVLIAWLDDRDTHHRDAIDLLASVDRFVVHPLTLAEVLVHPARSGRESDVMTRLEAIGMIVSTRPLDPVSLARTRVATRLKMPDCVVLACAIAHGVGVATFDDALRRSAEAPPAAPPQ
jgi:predicted nucleic acid-binding protein